MLGGGLVSPRTWIRNAYKRLRCLSIFKAVIVDATFWGSIYDTEIPDRVPFAFTALASCAIMVSSVLDSLTWLNSLISRLPFFAKSRLGAIVIDSVDRNPDFLIATVRDCAICIADMFLRC